MGFFSTSEKCTAHKEGDSASASCTVASNKKKNNGEIPCMIILIKLPTFLADLRYITNESTCLGKHLLVFFHFCIPDSLSYSSYGSLSAGWLVAFSVSAVLSKPRE